MSQPVVVTIPHKLGKQEAARRLKAGFGNVRSTFGEKFVVLKDDWAGDHLEFRASLLLDRRKFRLQRANGLSRQHHGPRSIAHHIRQQNAERR